MVFGIKTVKCLLFVFNFIFAIFGLAILALGVVYKLKIETIVDYLGDDFPIAPDLFIAIGTLAFIISFFGCIGASRENRVMLIVFVVLLIILLIVELTVVIIAFVAISNGKLEKQIEVMVKEEMNKGNLGNVETKLECCGVTDPFKSYGTIMEMPDTCFKDREGKVENLYMTGCFPKIKNIFHSIGVQLGAIAIAISIIEIVGTFFALTLSSLLVKARS